MEYPVKTSDNKWLEKVIELINQRISTHIIDDAFYDLNKNSECIKMFKRFSLKPNTLIFLLSYYVLSVICTFFFYLSFSLPYARTLSLLLSFLGIMVCIGIPTYYLRKNRPPDIIQTESGIDIVFSRFQKDNLGNEISKELSAQEDIINGPIQ
jgi:hypothetical protein